MFEIDIIFKNKWNFWLENKKYLYLLRIMQSIILTRETIYLDFINFMVFDFMSKQITNEQIFKKAAHQNWIIK